MLKPKIGCYAVYEPTEEGWENAGKQFENICTCLSNAGMEVIKAPETVIDENSCKRVAAWFTDKDIDILHPLIVTWSFDHFTVIIQQQNNVPVAIRTIPGIRSGSIVGGQQLGCILTDLGIEHKLFYGPTESVETAEEAAVYAAACALKKCLNGAKFAMLGRRTPGMTPIAFDEVEIMRLFGARIINLGMDEFNEVINSIDSGTADSEWQKISGRASSVTCSQESGIASTKFYIALKNLVKEHDFKAVSVGCYPCYLGKACMAVAILNDEGIAVGCEGDMNSTVIMYILSKLTGNAVHFGEMLEVDESGNSIISSHCGAAAPSLADGDGHILCPVRLANAGVCVRYTSKTGPVTYVNFVGRKGNYRLCAFEGYAVSTGMVFEGNPMKIKLNTPFRVIWNEISCHGFGHHWAAVYKHVVPTLQEFCRLTGIQGVFPDIRK